MNEDYLINIKITPDELRTAFANREHPVLDEFIFEILAEATSIPPPPPSALLTAVLKLNTLMREKVNQGVIQFSVTMSALP
jgi:hypothetical protein